MLSVSAWLSVKQSWITLRTFSKSLPLASFPLLYTFPFPGPGGLNIQLIDICHPCPLCLAVLGLELLTEQSLLATS